MTRPSGQNKPRRPGRHTRARAAARPSEGTEVGQAAPEAGLPATAPTAGEVPAGGPPDPAAAVREHGPSPGGQRPPRGARQQILLTPQGMIEEDPALAGLHSSAEQDTRTIAELAASVARSLADAPSEPPQSATGAPQEEPDPADGDAIPASPPEGPHGNSRASRKSWAAAAVAALLLLVIGFAYCQSNVSTSGSGNGAGDAGGAAAAPPVDGGGPAPSDNPDAAIAAPPTEAPAPAEPAPPPAVEIVEPPAPPPAAPAPAMAPPEPPPPARARSGPAGQAGGRQGQGLRGGLRVRLSP